MGIEKDCTKDFSSQMFLTEKSNLFTHV